MKAIGKSAFPMASEKGVVLIQEAHSLDEMHAPSLLPGLGLQQVHAFRRPPDDDVLRQVGEEPVHTQAADQ